MSGVFLKQTFFIVLILGAARFQLRLNEDEILPNNGFKKRVIFSIEVFGSMS